MKLLLIAGMGESVALAQQVSRLNGVEVVAVTEGRAVARAKPPVRVHEGRFADDVAFLGFIEAEDFDLVIDAAHPFQFRYGRVALASGRRYLRATRPLWTVRPEWSVQPALADVIAQLPQNACVFSVMGRGMLRQFQTRADVTVWCRQLDVHDTVFPLSKGGWEFGAGPFSVAQEVATFQRLNVTALVLRNTGSAAGFSKLEAAQQLGIHVALISAPRWKIPKSVQVPFPEIMDVVQGFADH
jgi:precorrin-6A/cobalt-precorrin-6A reductase